MADSLCLVHLNPEEGTFWRCVQVDPQPLRTNGSQKARTCPVAGLLANMAVPMLVMPAGRTVRL